LNMQKERIAVIMAGGPLLAIVSMHSLREANAPL
jgi:hypothetical protein